MSSISETGHAKNVANWIQLNTIVTSYGVTYNPSRVALKIPALQTMGTNAQKAITDVNTTRSAYKNATAARDVAFEAVNPLVSRILNALKATETSTQVDDNAKTIARKIQGQRASKKTKTNTKTTASETATVKEISSSQLSFDNRLANLDQLITLLESIPEYAPNEEALKTTGLRTNLTALKAKNDVAVAATVAYDNARNDRDEILYKPLTGLVDLSVDVKTYIKSVYGANSPQYKQVSALIFKAVKK